MSLLLKWLAAICFVLLFLLPCSISMSSFSILLDDRNITPFTGSVYLEVFVGLPILGLTVTLMAFAVAKGLDLLMEMEDSINLIKYMMQHNANTPNELTQPEKPPEN
jgi:hypothetical protein